jgi:hypothetical protein
LATKLRPYSNLLSPSWAADRQLSPVTIFSGYLLGVHYTCGVSLEKTTFQQLGSSTKLFQNDSGRFTRNFSYHPDQPADQISHIRNSIQAHKTTCLPGYAKSSAGPLANRGGKGLDTCPKVASVEQSRVVYPSQQSKASQIGKPIFFVSMDRHKAEQENLRERLLYELTRRSP